MNDDHDLLLAWRSGDAAAGQRLIERHLEPIHRFFSNKVPGATDDLVQKTFLACVEAVEAFEGRASFRSYLFGIARKGRIAVGYDADLTVADLKRRETITDGWISSRAGWTPYDGVTVTGWPIGTFVRGQRAMWEGEFVAAARGEPVQFLETLAGA